MKMMLILTKTDKDILERVAKDFDIKVEALADCYKAVMDSNFEQDLWDIANENADDLRKDYGKYEG